MSKQEHAEGLLWVEQDSKCFKMGLTPEFFRKTENIWHIMPPRNKKVTVGNPLLSIITYDDMSSIMSPHAGHIIDWNRRASDTPDRLTPDEIICVLTTEEVIEPPAPMSTREALSVLLQEHTGRVGTGNGVRLAARPAAVNPGAAIQGGSWANTSSFNWQTATQGLARQGPFPTMEAMTLIRGDLLQGSRGIERNPGNILIHVGRAISWLQDELAGILPASRERSYRERLQRLLAYRQTYS